MFNKFTECVKHCSMCYNETECYECTQGFYLDETNECKRKYILETLTVSICSLQHVKLDIRLSSPLLILYVGTVFIM